MQDEIHEEELLKSRDVVAPDIYNVSPTGRAMVTKELEDVLNKPRKIWTFIAGDPETIKCIVGSMYKQKNVFGKFLTRSDDVPMENEYILQIENNM